MQLFLWCEMELCEIAQICSQNSEVKLKVFQQDVVIPLNILECNELFL